jgi:TRAP transporter TAXI family solute receptor
MLDGIGMKPELDFQQVILDKAADGPHLVLDKKGEALWGAGVGWPGFMKVANGPAGARFVAPSAEQIKQILPKHPHLEPMSVPASTYKGQDMQIDSVGLWLLILVRPDVPDDVVYRLARAIHHPESELTKQLKQGRFTKVQNTVAQVPSARLHPGAVRYFREAGFMN